MLLIGRQLSRSRCLRLLCFLWTAADLEEDVRFAGG